MSLFFKRKHKIEPKVLVVGLDGVPYTLLKSLAASGHIPNMEAIFQKGYFGQMSVCIPEISSVSWSSFMTGTQSGEHGIYGFMDLQPGTYKMYFPNFNHLKVSALWEDLAQLGKKSIVINMPATYPAKEMNGALISGFVAIDINKAVYPSGLVPRLQEIGYRIDIDTMKARQDHDFLFRDLKETLEGRERAVDYLWKEIDWDLFIVVITGTDRLMHFLWDAFEDRNHAYHDAFLDYFRRVDAFVGKIYDRFMELKGSKEGKNDFYMLSDHGFTGIKTEVYLNRWLQENGYLKFQNERPETIMDIGPGSTAFALDPSRIYVNLRGKYPMGVVARSDYERVKEELKEGVSGIKFDDGSKAVKKVYFKEELYHGPYLDQAPDLIVLANKGYDLKGRVNSDAVFARTDLEGMHTQDDAFFFNSRRKRCDTIFDAKDLILEKFSNNL